MIIDPSIARASILCNTFLMTRTNPLQKQLELERFLRAAEYAKNSSQGLKKLGTTEVAYLNQLCLAKDDSTWRMEPAKIENAQLSNCD